VALAVLATGACSGGGGHGGTIPAGVAGGLAARADQVANDLAAGACDQARAEALSLQSDLAALAVDRAVRDQALAGAARLVAAISCAPPPTTPVTTVPGDVVPDSGPGKKHKGGHGHDD